MTLTTPLPSLAFTTEADTLTLTGAQKGDTVAVALYLRPYADDGSLTGLATSEPAISASLTADESGEVTLADLAAYLYDTMAGEAGAPLLWRLDVRAGGADTAHADLINTRARLALPAAEWVTRRPLTLMPRETIAWGAATPQLTLYAPHGLASARLTLETAAGEAWTADITASATARAGGRLWSMAWTWDQWFPDLKRFTEPYGPAMYEPFTARLEVRLKGADGEAAGRAISQCWRYEDLPEGGGVAVWEGAFGAWELMPLALITETHKPTRTSVWSPPSGRAVVSVTPATTIAVTSPALSRAMAPWAADFLEARRVTLRTADAETGLAVARDCVITDGQLEASGSPDALTRLTATLEETAPLPLRGTGIRAGGVFDETFDETFD